MYKTFTEIDNPDEGNCLFYALALAILHLLQQEQDEAGSRLTILLELLNEAEKTLLLDQIKYFSIEAINPDLMFNLQMTLRKLLVETRLKSIEEKFKKLYVKDEHSEIIKKISLADNIIFSDIMAILYFYYDETSDSAVDNEFSRDEVLSKKIKEIADQIKVLEKLQGNPLSALEKQMYVIPCLFQDEEAKSEQPCFSRRSVVAQKIYQMLNPGEWGTENDLGVLAEKLKLRVIIHHDGEEKYKPLLDDQPIVRINHKSSLFSGSEHWTTIFAEPGTESGGIFSFFKNMVVTPKPYYPTHAYDESSSFSQKFNLDSETFNTKPIVSSYSANSPDSPDSSDSPDSEGWTIIGDSQHPVLNSI